MKVLLRRRKPPWLRTRDDMERDRANAERWSRYAVIGFTISAIGYGVAVLCAIYGMVFG